MSGQHPVCSETMSAEGSALPANDGDDRLAALVRRFPKLFVLTGAGCSTASGLGDYRDREGRWKRRQPITGQDFCTNPSLRRRYWARSAIGWPLFHRARPAAAHGALAGLQRRGHAMTLVTQNVDRLHQRAGHRGVVDLHGVLATLSCIQCGWRLERHRFQRRLLSDNPWLDQLGATLAPDGDADLEHAAIEDMVVPDCGRCAGILKPDVVFFGEAVPKDRVNFALRELRRADALLVAGSSLMVYSGYRFCREANDLGLPIIIVNEGRTRADPMATLKIGGDCGQRLQRLLAKLAA